MLYRIYITNSSRPAVISRVSSTENTESAQRATEKCSKPEIMRFARSAMLPFSVALCAFSVVAVSLTILLTCHKAAVASHHPPALLLAHLAAEPGNREITMQLSHETLIKSYRDMVTIRRFEERVQEEFSKGGIPGFVHLYAGQEASAVGVCSHLGPRDYIASTHRGHGHSIAKGCDVTGMMLELFAKQGGLCGGKGGSMHIADLDQGMLGANGIVG